MIRAQLKGQAKDLISTAKPAPVYAGIIYVLLILLTGLLSAKLVGMDIDENVVARFVGTGDFEGFADYVAARAPSPGASALNAVLDILMLCIGAGFCIFALNTVRGFGASYWNLLDGFGSFLRIIWLYILEGVFIFLWSLLLFFPGIIAYYRYRQAIYLLLEHPEMSALECIRESKRMMVGHKSELFVLDLSFILWAIAYSVPYIGYVVGIYFIPYRELTLVLYYKELVNQQSFDRQSPAWSPEV